jgi:hypothetical protein
MELFVDQYGNPIFRRRLPVIGPNDPVQPYLRKVARRRN